jgi:peptidyl-prolyl cis-trans isomerase D
VVAPDRFLSSVKHERRRCEEVFDHAANDFRTPEQVRVEYVTLSTDALADAPVDPAEVKPFYDRTRGQFAVAESRQAAIC